MTIVKGKFAEVILARTEDDFKKVLWDVTEMNDDASCARKIARGGWAEERLGTGSCDFPIGPRNTWSNAAYVGAAGFILTQDRSASALVMAGALTTLGVGSALYHGYKTLWANKLDHVGMYLTFGALAVHGYGQYPHTPVAMAVTGVALAGLFTYTGIRVTLDVQVGLLLWFSLMPTVLKGNYWMAAAAFGWYIAGYIVWQLDKQDQPITGKWGHALWHILTSVAIGLTFLAQ